MEEQEAFCELEDFLAACEKLDACLTWNQVNFKKVECQCVTCLGFFAYVIPNDGNHTIVLGGRFWAAEDDEGYDSKVGTLFHECTHFFDFCNTKDMYYDLTSQEQVQVSQQSTTSLK